MKKERSMAASLVATRGNRCSASILGYLENNVYENHPTITTHEQKQIRQFVLDTINNFKDLSIDIVKSDSAVINDEWAKKIDEIHQAIKYG
jgi:hypothetical protein